MIVTAMYLYGAIQGAWPIGYPIVGYMLFDLMALELASPDVNL